MSMQAWRASGGRGSIALRRVPEPVLHPDGIIVRMEACGICRTDLHIVDGELAPHKPETTPGHQVVGRVVAVGAEARGFDVDDLAGIAWLRSTCGACRWCRSGRENLCPGARFTGWDTDGGFAEYAEVPAAYAYRLPPDADPVRTAPLLCAGIIGFRALQRAALPAGGRLALFGFGSSAAITARVAEAAGAEVVVVTRGEANRRLAVDMGFEVTPDETSPPRRPVDAAIVFAPSSDLVPLALGATEPGGTVVVAGIHLSPIPSMDYDRFLFQERDLRSVTANTRADGDAFLRLAARLDVAPTVTVSPFEHLEAALEDLRSGRASGSLVLAAAR